MINKYFTDFGNKINNMEFIISSEIHTRKVNDYLGIIEGKIVFEIGVLVLLEVIKITDIHAYGFRCAGPGDCHNIFRQIVGGQEQTVSNRTGR